MTIVAGFKTREGIVLCADTQETIGGISKRNVSKLRLEPNDQSPPIYGPSDDDPDKLAVAFCGATDNGTYLDMLIDEAWRTASAAASLSEACDLIRHSIKETYREYGGIYQPGHLPSTEIIYGVKMGRSSKLFYAFGPAISESDRYLTGGVGTYMADFVASRMYSHLSIRQCIILAAYVLFQAKEHVDGCGGESHIAVLRHEAISGRVNPQSVETATKLLEVSDSTIGKLLIHYADIALTKEEFTEKTRAALDDLDEIRGLEIKKFQKDKKLWNRLLGLDIDEAGLPSVTRVSR